MVNSSYFAHKVSLVTLHTSYNLWKVGQSSVKRAGVPNSLPKLSSETKHVHKTLIKDYLTEEKSHNCRYMGSL